MERGKIDIEEEPEDIDDDTSLDDTELENYIVKIESLLNYLGGADGGETGFE